MFKRLYAAFLILLLNCFFISQAQAKPLSEYIAKLAPDDGSLYGSISEEDQKMIADREQDAIKFCDLIVSDDINNISISKNTVFEKYLLSKTEFTKITSREFYDAYKSNQAESDEKFLDKQVLVLGLIEKIASSEDNTPVLHLNTQDTKQPGGTHASFKDPGRDKTRIAKLKPGEEIILLCNGAGMVSGIPSLNECEFIDDYMAQYRKDMHERLLSVINGDLKASRFALASMIFSYAMLVDDPRHVKELIQENIVPDTRDKVLKHTIFVLLWTFEVETPVPIVLTHKDKVRARLLKHELWKYLIFKKIIEPKKGKLLVKDFDFDNTPMF